MTDPILDDLRTRSGVEVDEVIGAPRDRLDLLTALLLRYFPEHAHVAGELEQAWAGQWPDDLVVIHAWLLTRHGEPFGFTVFHTSLRRQVVLQHFVGVDPAVARDLPLRWVKYLAEAVVAVGVRDCEQNDGVLLASMGENHAEHARTWERFGYTTLDIDYREPHHGREWASYGPPTFFPMTPQIRRTDAGRDLPMSVVADAAVRAFLLDHYLLPEDEPSVARTLTLVAALPD